MSNMNTEPNGVSAITESVVLLKLFAVPNKIVLHEIRIMRAFLMSSWIVGIYDMRGIEYGCWLLFTFFITPSWAWHKTQLHMDFHIDLES